MGEGVYMTDFTEEKIKKFKEKFDTEIVKYNRDSPVIQFLVQAISEAREETFKNVGSWYNLPKYKNFNGGCSVCGSKPVKIRGKYPHEPKRLICPTCTREVLESILDGCNNRQAYTAQKQLEK